MLLCKLGSYREACGADWRPALNLWFKGLHWVRQFGEHFLCRHRAQHLNMTSKSSERQKLRQQIRSARQQLSFAAQTAAAQTLVQVVLAAPEIQQANRIALYLSNDGELDTMPLIQALWQQGKQVALPVLHLFTPGHLVFQRYSPTTQLRPNQFGIMEPVPNVNQLVLLTQLEVICMPLVAFDDAGNRLGMGGGFYDRTLARSAQLPQPPTLVGLAHHCQQVASIPSEAWDVPLPMIATPDQLWRF